MTDVAVTNGRADSSASEDLTRLARHGADTFGYKANLRIERKLAQLLRPRVSQINKLHLLPQPALRGRTRRRHRPTGDRHPDRVVGDRVPRRRRQRRARLHRGDHSRRRRDRADDFGARHDALAARFSQEEILEIIGMVINMNVWTRLKLAEGASPGIAEQAMS